MNAIFLSLVLLAPAHAAPSVDIPVGELRVAPFLQDATPTSMWVGWETTSGETPTVHWGTTDALGESATGSSLDSEDGGRIHHAQITGLSADTRYFYQVTTGDVSSEIYDFITPPDSDADRSFRILAMSDMQQSSRDPNKFSEIIHDGVLAWAEDQWGDDVAAQFAMVLIPGDLVDAGNTYEEWADTFFGPLAPISARVPVYPVLGNHEANTHWYFDYFHLPEHGEADPERWWSTTYDNLLLLGLDSNAYLTWTSQLDWLTARLDQACDDDSIDFAFAEVHAPFESEVWVPGNSPFTGQIRDAMAAFSERCGKPSAHLFGHTHAYSRGQVRDHRHLMVNVATAGGAIDYWDEQLQKDYAEFTASDDDWGFVILDVDSGSDPKFRLRRYSRGDNIETLDNVLTDEVEVRLNNAAPATPTPLSPFGEAPGACVVMSTADFSDPDGDGFQASQWQVSPRCDTFEQPLIDHWFQSENRYMGVDTQAQDDLTDDVIYGLAKGTYCWRARHRDDGLMWSAWSEPVPFEVTHTARSANLLLNPGAEDALDSWMLDEGTVEITANGLCDTHEPTEGAHAFAFGGRCAESLPASMSSQVSLTGVAVDAEPGFAHVAADLLGGDLVATLIFRDATSAELGTETRTLSGAATWTHAEVDIPLPANTATIALSLSSTSVVEVDAIELSVGNEGARDCTPSLEVPVDDTDTPVDSDGDACGCSSSGSAVGWFAPLLLLGWRRRRA